MSLSDNYTVMPIEQDRQIPKSMALTGGCPPKYPWYDLAVSVGDPPKGPSFLVRCPSIERKRLWSTLGSCARNVERRSGRKFTLRTDKKGIRVWRIK